MEYFNFLSFSRFELVYIFYLFILTTICFSLFLSLPSKIPAIKRKTVELNGVLVTHALITLRELTIKCAQHYSWYCVTA